MLKIRLQRMGKKKSPTYRFVVSESSKDLYGKQVEIVGHYNPFSKVCEVKKDRILYWMSVGAQPSPTVHNLLVDQNVITSPKVVASKSKKKSAEGEPATGGKEAVVAAAPVEAPAPTATETPAPEVPAPAPAEEKK